MIFLVIVP